MSGPNPRAAAVAALVRQEQDGFSNLILDAELRRQKLEGRDKAFASAIFYTVLEHQGTLDYILSQFLPKGLARLDPQVREILRAALAQARYMQVPASAAVNEAVKLTRSFKKSSASGLVNADLRKACVYDLDKAVFKDEIEKLMVLGSASREVAEFLHRHYPEEALGILTHTADGGMTSLRANPLKASAAQLRELLMQNGAKSAEPGIVPGSVLARFEGSPAEQELFRQGYYHVEGQASQLAALCVEAKPGDTVLDLCAAPGGKTLLLAEEMQGTGRLISCDVTENYTRLVKSIITGSSVGSSSLIVLYYKIKLYSIKTARLVYLFHCELCAVLYRYAVRRSVTRERSRCAYNKLCVLRCVTCVCLATARECRNRHHACQQHC